MRQHIKPDVSVIIPFRNAEKTIELCIRSVLTQNLNAVEILVVNNCSDDAGPGVVRTIHDKRLQLLDEPIPGAATARNRGLDNASGEYVLFLDADVELPDSHWLSRALANLKAGRSKGIVGVGGVGRSSHPSRTARALDILIYEKAPDTDRIVAYLPTMDLLMRSEDIGKERFLPELLRAEDPEFCFRFADKGLRFFLASDLAVKHHHPTTLKGLLQRWYRYGLYYSKPYALHPRQMNRGYWARMGFIVLTFFSLIVIALDWRAVLLPSFMILGLFFSYIWRLERSGVPFCSLFSFAALHTVKQLSQLSGITASLMGAKLSQTQEQNERKYISKRVDDTKFKRFWIVGSFLSAILYYTGLVRLYVLFRKRVLKRYRTIILTYHRIRDDSKDSHISVSTKNFESQMVCLKKHFNVISLNTLVKNVHEKSDALMDNVAITFDDGYKDNFLNAYPILRKHRLPATIFLVSKLVGKSEKMLNVDDIKLMKSDGIYFGSHTRTHKTLTEIDINTATEEIHNSKTELERLLNEKIDFFAYPRGKRAHFNEDIKAQVKRSGYKAAFTTENGEINEESGLFELKRIGIRNCPFFVFKTRVSGIFESRLFYAARKVLKLT